MNKRIGRKFKTVSLISLVLGSILHAILSKYLQMSYLRFLVIILSICMVLFAFANYEASDLVFYFSLSLAFFGYLTSRKSPAITKKQARKFIFVIFSYTTYLSYLVFRL